jgi:hypothetical protein
VWPAAGIDLARAVTWYREIGQGMGVALNTAGTMGYLHDLRSRHLGSVPQQGDFAVAVEGDRRLFDQYGATLVNPAHIQRPRRGAPAFTDLPRGATDDREVQDQQAAVVSSECQRRGGERRSVAQAGNTARRDRKWFALDYRPLDPATNP